MNSLVNNIFWGLLLQGIFLIIFGILLFVWPELLNILISAFVIASGVVAIVWAFYTKKYTK
jgi:uncharacterized membrane protein HdeD (DUF308 family)